MKVLDTDCTPRAGDAGCENAAKEPRSLQGSTPTPRIYTLHPATYTPNPKPQTLIHKPYTQNSDPSDLHPTPQEVLIYILA